MRIVELAGGRCEYCLMPQELVATAHQIDHVVAEKHGGATILENLALSCTLCNLRKGGDIASNDPETRKIVRLFHPRQQVWHEHFRLSNDRIEGITSTGRTTAHFLQLNLPERIIERAALRVAGVPLDAFLIRKPR